MSVSRGEVEQMAALARLKLEPAEAARITGEMNAILEHMAALREVEVEGVTQDVGIVEGGAPFRSSRAAPDPLHREPAGIAPDWREGFFVVPRLPAVEGHAGDADTSVEAGS